MVAIVHRDKPSHHRRHGSGGSSSMDLLRSLSHLILEESNEDEEGSSMDLFQNTVSDLFATFERQSSHRSHHSHLSGGTETSSFHLKSLSEIVESEDEDSTLELFLSSINDLPKSLFQAERNSWNSPPSVENEFGASSMNVFKMLDDEDQSNHEFETLDAFSERVAQKHSLTKEGTGKLRSVVRGLSTLRLLARQPPGASQAEPETGNDVAPHQPRRSSCDSDQETPCPALTNGLSEAPVATNKAIVSSPANEIRTLQKQMQKSPVLATNHFQPGSPLSSSGKRSAMNKYTLSPVKHTAPRQRMTSPQPLPDRLTAKDKDLVKHQDFSHWATDKYMISPVVKRKPRQRRASLHHTNNIAQEQAQTSSASPNSPGKPNNKRRPRRASLGHPSSTPTPVDHHHHHHGRGAGGGAGGALLPSASVCLREGNRGLTSDHIPQRPSRRRSPSPTNRR